MSIKSTFMTTGAVIMFTIIVATIFSWINNETCVIGIVGGYVVWLFGAALK